MGEFDRGSRKSMVVFTRETHRRVKSIRGHDPAKLLARIPNKIQASNNLSVMKREGRSRPIGRERDPDTTDHFGQLMSRFSDILLFPLISSLLLLPPPFPLLFFSPPPPLSFSLSLFFLLLLRFWFEKGPVRGIFIPNSHCFFLRSPVYT